MAIKHIDGDFEPEHFSREFGFHGSAEMSRHGGEGHQGAHHLSHAGAPPKEGYAHGGEVQPPHHIHPHGHRVVKIEASDDGSVVHHHAHGGYTVHHPDGEISHHHRQGTEVKHDGFPGGEAGAGVMIIAATPHPHGHHVVHVEHGHDGSKIHHHAHGGYTVHHADGNVTHHDASGTFCHGGAMHRAHGGYSAVGVHPHGHHVIGTVHKADGSEVHHHEHGGFTIHHAHGGISHHHSDGTGATHGDAAQDKAMIRSAFEQHDAHEHGGVHENIKLAHGGYEDEEHHARGGRAPFKGPSLANTQTTPFPVPAPSASVRRPAIPRSAAPSLGVAGPGPGLGNDSSLDGGDGPSALKHGGRPRHKREEHQE